ncbi:hypothetical protein Dsin_017315 [Dipteronia sinensis]|uniref:Uncharacterized protein n=1 Tax=Dipteronia sinensis TaxID=43782 RepID=A0AAE0AF34_9ROSI|nr:hypothetical protein Dsin_017315 [Dipteronia sinensis]
MSGMLVQCGEHWKGNQFTRPIEFAFYLNKKDKGSYDGLVEMKYQRTRVSRDKFELKITSHVKMEDDAITLSIMSDDDVDFVMTHKEKHVVVDDNDSFESIDTLESSDSSKTSDTEDDSGGDDGGQAATEDGIEELERLSAYFYVLEQSNPVTVTKIKTDSKNRFKYGFNAVGASIEGFSYIIRPVIAIDATHLKARTKDVLLVAVCKDGNEMMG